MLSLLNETIRQNASDLHLIAGLPPVLRVNGELKTIRTVKELTGAEIMDKIFTLMKREQKENLLKKRELDFSYQFEDKARFRINVYYQKGSLAAALRLLPVKISDIAELGLPKICYKLSSLRQGFVLITGPTGHGKTTTIAAMINEINKNFKRHIVTIEDPIEYIFSSVKSIISQRELSLDTFSWAAALRSVLREDPDVVLIGEMRDYETVAAALTVAETGHLVFATLHTNSASQTIDRVVDVFPEHAKEQARLQLAQTLEAVLSQRLVPSVGEGRLPTFEIMTATPAVRNNIREGKTHLLDNIIRTSSELGMQSLEKDLSRLYKEGRVTLETAQQYAFRLEEFLRLVK